MWLLFSQTVPEKAGALKKGAIQIEGAKHRTNEQGNWRVWEGDRGFGQGADNCR